MFPVGERFRCNTKLRVGEMRVIRPGSTYFVVAQSDAGTVTISREWTHPETKYDRCTIETELFAKSFDWLAQLEVTEGKLVAIKQKG